MANIVGRRRARRAASAERASAHCHTQEPSKPFQDPPGEQDPRHATVFFPYAHTRPSDPSPCASGEGQGPEQAPPTPETEAYNNLGPTGVGESGVAMGDGVPPTPQRRGRRPRLMSRLARGPTSCPEAAGHVQAPQRCSLDLLRATPTLILLAGTAWQCTNAVAAVSWAARVRCHWCRAGGGRVSCLFGQRPCQAPSFERRGGPQVRVNLPPRAPTRWPGGAACVGGRAPACLQCESRGHGRTRPRLDRARCRPPNCLRSLRTPSRC